VARYARNPNSGILAEDFVQTGERDYRTLRAEEFAGDVEGFTTDDDDLLAIEELLCHDAGKATEEMALAVNDDLCDSQNFHVSGFAAIRKTTRRGKGGLGKAERTTGSKVDILLCHRFTRQMSGE
jgi:hypothetical protein